MESKQLLEEVNVTQICPSLVSEVITFQLAHVHQSPILNHGRLNIKVHG